MSTPLPTTEREAVASSELLGRIERHIAEARSQRKSPKPECTREYSEGFYDGEIFALEKVKAWMLRPNAELTHGENNP